MQTIELINTLSGLKLLKVTTHVSGAVQNLHLHLRSNTRYASIAETAQDQWLVRFISPGQIATCSHANAEVITTWEECAMWMREWEHGKLTRSGDPEDWVGAAYDWEDMMVPSS